MITVDSVSYSYPFAARPAIRDVSVTIAAGELLGVIGRNGGGKSTLAAVLTGFAPHFFRGVLTGRVTIAGHDTATTSLGALTPLIGLVFQNPTNQITGTAETALGEVVFGLENLGAPPETMRERAMAAMAATGVAHLADRPIATLSGGETQRVAIAAVLAMAPPALVLDEPTAQLDPIGSRDVLATARRLADNGRAIVLIEHRLEWLAAYADRIALLHDGQIARIGHPAEVLTDPALPELLGGELRYTAAARRARAIGLWPPDRPLPVTLAQAIDGFVAARARVGRP